MSSRGQAASTESELRTQTTTAAGSIKTVRRRKRRIFQDQRSLWPCSDGAKPPAVSLRCRVIGRRSASYIHLIRSLGSRLVGRFELNYEARPNSNVRLVSATGYLTIITRTPLLKRHSPGPT